MSRLKNTVLVASMTLAVLAVAGTGSAMATTVLCAETGEARATCATGTHTKEFSGEIKLESSNSELATNLGTVKCTGSAATLKPEAATGTPTITGKVEALSFTGCKVGETACAITVNGLPYTAHLEALGEAKSSLAATNSTWFVKCGSIINCNFGKSETSITGANGSPTTFAAKELELNPEGGAFCPSSAKWTATYSVTSPAGGVTVDEKIAGPAAVLCAETGAASEACTTGAHTKEFSGEVKLESSNSELATNLGSVKCTGSVAILKPEAATGAPTITVEVKGFIFTSCKLGESACIINVNSLPYTAHLEALGEGKSSLVETNPSMTVKCAAFIHCSFGKPELTLTGANGSPTTFKAEAVKLNIEGGLICPTTATWTATYSVTSPAGGVTVD